MDFYGSILDESDSPKFMIFFDSFHFEGEYIYLYQNEKEVARISSKKYNLVFTGDSDGTYYIDFIEK